MTLHLSPRAEHGFSMIELLVAMAAAAVVIAALVTILQVTYGQETRTTDHTQANQIGRTAMSKVIEELHSSCTGIAPIRQGAAVPEYGLGTTGPLNLWFISVYGSPTSGAASLEGATEHDINWTKTGTSNTGEMLGTLTDYEFAGSGNIPAEWSFSTSKANMKKKILAKNVIPSNGASTIFRLYHYSTGKFVSEAPASAEAAEKVTKVTIGFTQAPEDGDTRFGRPVSLGDAVVFRLDPTESSSEGPCE
jgi:prepilin-type N-terminal cleavage/methylation domain-containing protein